jgi:hypothetical protein
MGACEGVGSPILARKRAILEGAVLLAAVTAALLSSTTASAQAGPNVIREIRPLVEVCAPAVCTDLTASMPGANQPAIGLFDTGSNAVFIAPETNQLFGIAPIDVGGIIGQPVSVTVGGFLGSAITGREKSTTGPAHVAAAGFLLNRTEISTRPMLAPFLSNFVNLNHAESSIVNIGMPFVGGTPGLPSLVVEIDPINASYVPFAFNNTNQANLARPRFPVDQTTSSVSFFAANSDQVPTSTRNANPPFLTTLRLMPNGGEGNFNRVDAADDASMAPLPQVVIDATASNNFGRALTRANSRFPLTNKGDVSTYRHLSCGYRSSHHHKGPAESRGSPWYRLLERIRPIFRFFSAGTLAFWAYPAEG